MKKRREWVRMTFGELWDRAEEQGKLPKGVGPFTMGPLHQIADALFRRTSTDEAPQVAFDRAVDVADRTLTAWCKDDVSAAE